MYQNPEASHLYQQFTRISIAGGATVASSEKIYLNDSPLVLSRLVVGIVGYTPPLQISTNTAVPTTGQFVSILGGFPFGVIPYLYLTIANKAGEILFNQIPYASLISLGTTTRVGRIKCYTAKNVDLSKSYYQLAPGVTLSGTVTFIAPLSFYLK